MEQRDWAGILAVGMTFSNTGSQYLQMIIHRTVRWNNRQGYKMYWLKVDGSETLAKYLK